MRWPVATVSTWSKRPFATTSNAAGAVMLNVTVAFADGWSNAGIQ
ncbi:MAG TPA: hypothetical protein VFU83_03160 [Pyrinomonadaceae bacterium]|nr:hypothetical protein [Pyrinomonadaceae bacterium]